MSKKCKHCSAMNPDGSNINYCANCGKPLDSVNHFLLIDTNKYLWGDKSMKEIRDKGDYQNLSDSVKSLTAQNEDLKRQLERLRASNVSPSTVSSLRSQLSAAQRERDKYRNKYSNTIEGKLLSWTGEPTLGDALSLLGGAVIGILAIVFLLWWLISSFNSCSSDKDEALVEFVRDPKTGKYGLRNIEEDVMVQACQYDTIEKFYNFYLLKGSSNIGLARANGKSIISGLDSVKNFGSDLIVMYKGDKQGLLNTNGKLIVKPEYAYVINTVPLNTLKNPVGNIIPCISENNGHTLVNRENGKKIGDKEYFRIFYTNSKDAKDCIFVRDDKYWGMVNKDGKEVIPLKYVDIFGGSDQRVWAILPNAYNWQCFDLKGKKVFTLNSNLIPWTFSEGLAAVEKDGLLGYYDKSGKMVIPHLYTRDGNQVPGFIKNSSGCYAYVLKDGVKGKLDKDGNFTPLQ